MTMMRCFRSTFSEWIIDPDNDRYIRRERADAPTDTLCGVDELAELRDCGVCVPYENGWRPMEAWRISDRVKKDGRRRMYVRDPSHPDWMITTVEEVQP